MGRQVHVWRLPFWGDWRQVLHRLEQKLFNCRRLPCDASSATYPKPNPASATFSAHSGCPDPRPSSTW